MPEYHFAGVQTVHLINSSFRPLMPSNQHLHASCRVTRVAYLPPTTPTAAKTAFTALGKSRNRFLNGATHIALVFPCPPHFLLSSVLSDAQDKRHISDKVADFRITPTWLY